MTCDSRNCDERTDIHFHGGNGTDLSVKLCAKHSATLVAMFLDAHPDTDD